MILKRSGFKDLLRKKGRCIGMMYEVVFRVTKLTDTEDKNEDEAIEMVYHVDASEDGGDM